MLLQCILCHLYQVSSGRNIDIARGLQQEVERRLREEGVESITCTTDNPRNALTYCLSGYEVIRQDSIDFEVKLLKSLDPQISGEVARINRSRYREAKRTVENPSENRLAHIPADEAARVAVVDVGIAAGERLNSGENSAQNITKEDGQVAIESK